MSKELKDQTSNQIAISDVPNSVYCHDAGTRIGEVVKDQKDSNKVNLKDVSSRIKSYHIRMRKKRGSFR